MSAEWKEDEEYSTIEHDAATAAATLALYLKAQPGNANTAAIDAAHTLAKAINWFSLHAREQRRQIGELEREADGIHGAAQRAAAILTKAAEAKAQMQRDALSTLKALLPQAKTQARKGKPALLRMILRATR